MLVQFLHIENDLIRKVIYASENKITEQLVCSTRVCYISWMAWVRGWRESHFGVVGVGATGP